MKRIFLPLILLFLLENIFLFNLIVEAKNTQKKSSKRPILLKEYKKEVPAEGHLIQEVPFYKQENNHYCAPAVLCMVLNYWQKEKSFNQEEIASSVYQSKAEITNNSDIVFYPAENGFLVYSFNGDIEKLKRLVRENIPVIILQQVIPQVKKGHYRVVIGYDDIEEVVIVHDPLLGEKRILSYDIFMELWNFGEEANRKSWALIVLPSDRGDILEGMGKSYLTHHNVATALYNRGRLQEAIEEWGKAIAIESVDATPYYCIAYAYIKTKDFDKAIHYAQLAIELDNNNSFCYDTLGWAYYQKGMLDEALKCLEKALEMKPKAEFIKSHFQIVQQEIEAKETESKH